MAGTSKAWPNKGFTLIELLVAMAIVGILSSIVITTLSTARASARNARKEADLDAVASALRIYYVNNGGVGPANTVPTANWSNIQTSLPILVTQGYISKLPTPPDATTYYYYNSGNYLLLAAYLEPPAYGPGAAGWHCSDAQGGTGTSKYYCLNVN